MADKRTLDDIFADRARLDAEYWARSEELTNEVEELMKTD